MIIIFQLINDQLFSTISEKIESLNACHHLSANYLSTDHIYTCLR
jgi:hypothetical protein